MSTIKIDNFAGISPRQSARLLSYNSATTAANAKLLSGELRGLRETQILHDFGLTPTARAYRLPATVGAPLPIGTSDFWVGFASNEVDFVRTPVLEDQYERYYWTGDTSQHSGVPQYNTRARIQAGQPSFVLGIPIPVNALTVTPATGIDIVRSYVYTFVSAYGEEGPPSNATQATGTAGVWTLTGFDTSIPNASNYNITKIHIYRTVADSTSTTAQYFYVDTVDFGTTSYTDRALDLTVALNYILPSLTWDAPPAGLKGLISHPGGFMIGFLGRDLYMSDPYHPHAWPVQNILTCATEIVGVAVYNNIIMVTTTSHPYYAEGMSPAAITLQKIDSIDPCVSRRSIATTLSGVYYASPQGIIVATAGATQLATQGLFTREEWQLYFSPTTVQAVPYGLQYIAFDTTSTGFIFSPAESLAPLTTLDRFSNVGSIQIDQYSGDVYIVQGNQVRLWDPPESTPYEYTWVSKQFDLSKPVSMGAMKVKFNGGGYQIPDNLLADYTSFNTQRITQPLNCLNLAPINGVRTMAGITGPGAIVKQIKSPLAGSPLFGIGSLNNVVGAVQVTIFARTPKTQVWTPVFTWTATDERTYRLPAGFKSDGWQIQLIGNVPVYSFAMAETGKELQQV
ncbi:MAG: hypothetical protein M3O20_01165 [Acidobacteriota bacterium]|nr:hypothetical protein [Acidobacteriota bacterium]